MTTETRWLLPDGIDELLPDRALPLEALRRRLLDQCATWGYRFVIPPLVEFTDSLLVGLGADLDLMTCKFSDRASGRMLGVRADITPQVARIDAHSLAEDGVTRLCYAGSTLLSAPQSATAGRAPIQLGAELFGSESIEADLEVVRLLLSLLEGAGVSTPLTLDLGHIGIYDALFSGANLDPELEQAIFDALQRKSAPDLDQLAQRLDAGLVERLRQLASLHGSVEVLDRAREWFGGEPAVMAALNEVSALVGAVTEAFPSVALYVDLTELRGFRYHTGLVFAVYVEGRGSAVAKGGRYDNIGAVFGRDRPATGFAIDLKALVDDVACDQTEHPPISAPQSDDPDLAAAVATLRAQGRAVAVDLEGSAESSSGARLVKVKGQWIVESPTGEDAE
jgi:ATP phosphoribosyltransferase regulatory subunit